MKCQACIYFSPDMKNPYFGSCSNEKRKLQKTDVFPEGIKPSVSVSHGCDLGVDFFCILEKSVVQLCNDKGRRD